MASRTCSTTALLASFVLGSTVTMAVSYAVIRLRKRHAQQDVDVPTTRTKTTISRNSKSCSMPNSLREEQLSRHTLYFGEDGMSKLRGASVVVVGLGGVGSHAAHMLARAGVSHLRLIDFDQVTLSSLNRHACATLAHVGIPKVTCVQQFLQQICPDPSQLTVEPIVEMYTSANGTQLLHGKNWDIVIDAIDDVPTKAALLACCMEKHFRVISCMGAGGKSDVTRLHISDLRTASRDPLASKLRQHLKKLLPDDSSYMDTMEQLAVVYSSEKTVMKLADFSTPEQKDAPHDYGAVDGMRIRVLPVLGTMPAVMGMTCAAMALCELGNKPFLPVTGERVGRNVRNRLLQKFQQRENKITNAATAAAAWKEDTCETSSSSSNSIQGGKIVNGQWVGPIQINGDDVEYLMEIWRNRCAVTGDRLGTVLELVRWDMTKPSTCDNIVLMGLTAVQQYDAGGTSSFSTEIQSTIHARLALCRPDAYAY